MGNRSSFTRHLFIVCEVEESYRRALNKLRSLKKKKKMFTVTPELPVNMGVEKQAANQSCVGTQLQKNFTPAVFALRKEKKKTGIRKV